MDWMQLLSTFGAPMFVLIAIGVGGWRVLGWVGRELVIPARDKLFARVDSFCLRVEETLDKQCDAISKQAEATARLADRLPPATGRDR